MMGYIRNTGADKTCGQTRRTLLALGRLVCGPALLAMAMNPALAQTAPDRLKAIPTPDQLPSSLGTLEFTDGAPSAETAARAYDYLDRMHAVESFVNAYRGASTMSIFKGMKEAGIPNNTALIFSDLMDSKSLFLTANADVIYFWVNLEFTEGPLVIETPPQSLGVIDDMWFRWVTDFGFPGPDRGEGGKYLLVPPGYKGELPTYGYIVRKVRTNRAMVLGRSFLANEDPKPTVELIRKTLKIYPYLPGGLGTSIASALEGKATLARSKDNKLDWAFLRPEPPATFIEGTGKVINTIPPSDFSYYELLNELVQQEPTDALDPEIMGSLAAIGIAKGKPFKPDARMKDILIDAAAIGTAVSRTLNWRPRDSEGFYYYPDSAWMNMLFVGGYDFDAPPPEVSADGTITVNPTTGARKLNARTAMFYYATGITPAMIMRLTGIGSQYLGAFFDSNGDYFDGGKTYKVTLPKGIPEEKFWSITAYDNQTRSMLATPQLYPRAGSQNYPGPAAVTSRDGSTTVFFGPEKPADAAAGNWIQTTPGKGWNMLLRLYSPLEPFFTKTWRPSEVEPVK
tara:strand:- start:89698 stop:91404 length:1707 start_codon:yes stop_codon:yes gene_type:complete